MRPKLPSVIEQQLPESVLQNIYSFLSYPKRKKIGHSPSLQRELTRIQSTELKGKSGIYMKDLDDFCLD